MREQFVTWFFTITAKILTSRCRGVNFLGENISFRNALRMAEKGGGVLIVATVYRRISTLGSERLLHF